MPLWLSPTQVRVIPLKPEFLDFSKNLEEKLSQNQIRVDIDDRNESVGKRIREAETEWIRYILVIGEKEVNATNLNVSDRETGNVSEIPLMNNLYHKSKNKPKENHFQN